MPWMPRQKQNIGWMPFSDKHILPVHNSLHWLSSYELECILLLFSMCRLYYYLHTIYTGGAGIVLATAVFVYAEAAGAANT